jgi:hypothetical protein
MNINEIAAWLDNLKRQVATNATSPGLLSARVGDDVRAWDRGNRDAFDATRSVMPDVRSAGAQEAIDNMRSTAGLLSGIVKPSVAMRIPMETRLPDRPEFVAATANTPGAQITPDGLLMRVQRNQLPEQGQQESVRGGVFYLPEGAAQAKHYTHNNTPGANNYGGSERITGETLVRNPLFAKGGTGGKAPENAYDALNGKGAYQEMRSDALHWSGGPSDIREEAVTKFLEKYAPEMADKAGYILQNSKKGNQLAYALQEAAVASAVRKAGHDAVLGFSKGKSGPFLSELFDVRESHYPDKFGFSRLWDQFEP